MTEFEIVRAADGQYHVRAQKCLRSARPVALTRDRLGRLARYATACACVAPRYRVVAMVSANGVKHYRLACTACARLSGKSIPKHALDPDVMDAAVVVASNTRRDKECARCGEWRNGVEEHHWAPFGVFDDAGYWPTAWLCRDCHVTWHERMNGYRFERPLAAAKKGWR